MTQEILDFRPGADMTWEIQRTDDVFEVLFWLPPTGPIPPLHVHPSAEESYEVVEGAIQVDVDGEWRTVGTGEKLTVPAGVHHTLRPVPDASDEAKLINVHDPALDFETLFRRFHRLSSTGAAELPPKDLRSIVNLALLFSAHPGEIRSVRPPQQVLDAIAFVARRLGRRLDD